MAEERDLTARVRSLEERVDAVESEVSTARHLAAFADRDLADLAIKVDANTKAISALGEQTAAQFREVRGAIAGLENGQQSLRDGQLELRDGMGRIIGMLDRLSDDEDQH